MVTVLTAHIGYQNLFEDAILDILRVVKSNCEPFMMQWSLFFSTSFYLCHEDKVS